MDCIVKANMLVKIIPGRVSRRNYDLSSVSDGKILSDHKRSQHRVAQGNGQRETTLCTTIECIEGAVQFRSTSMDSAEFKRAESSSKSRSSSPQDGLVMSRGVSSSTRQVARASPQSRLVSRQSITSKTGQEGHVVVPEFSIDTYESDKPTSEAWFDDGCSLDEDATAPEETMLSIRPSSVSTHRIEPSDRSTGPPRGILLYPDRSLEK